ncbi:hypothetical protein ACFL6C_06660 [Myxococcota bacterium]
MQFALKIALEQLIKGEKRDSIIGRALLDGRYPARDVTTRFKELYNQGLEGKPPEKAESIELPKNKNDFEYFFLEGLFGQNLPGYMEVNREGMEKAGVVPDQIQFATYNTTTSTFVNAVRIAEQILAGKKETNRNAILVTHSMGGRHAQVILAGTWEEFQEAGVTRADFDTVLQARESVAGNLLMQPAINAQIAKDVRHKEVLRPVLDEVMFLVGGKEAALADMSAEQLPQPFPGDEYPTVVLASDSNGNLSLLGGTIKQYHRKRYGVPSDAAVPTPEQVGINQALMICRTWGPLEITNKMRHSSVMKATEALTLRRKEPSGPGQCAALSLRE